MRGGGIFDSFDYFKSALGLKKPQGPEQGTAQATPNPSMLSRITGTFSNIFSKKPEQPQPQPQVQVQPQVGQQPGI